MKPLPATDLKKADSPHGFTLIELLVVLAIISLLVAILIPCLSRAKACAQLLDCRGNLRTLGIAWIDYLADHDGRFLQRPNASTNYGGWKGLDVQKDLWPRPLNRYIGFGDPNGVTERMAAKDFCCPADRGGIPGAYLLERAYRAVGTSYQTNPLLIGWGSCAPLSPHTQELDLAIAAKLPNLNVNQVAGPHHDVVLLGDHGWVNQWSPMPLPFAEWKQRAEWHGKPDFHAVAFLDGHVEYRRIEKGIYVAPQYRVQPFTALDEQARQCQGPTQ
ncbi:MAG: prepilin-type N-terminal cleavage/methylation domain-containing protein [Sedimentisphaerales bacterium]|nr:prepilin-type N-terminal cleavage/methylation domain-containing protein [Sedimentisphaerales bacterium]